MFPPLSLSLKNREKEEEEKLGHAMPIALFFFLSIVSAIWGLCGSM